MGITEKIKDLLPFSLFVLPPILIIAVFLLGGANILEYMHFSFEVKLILLISPFAIVIQKKNETIRFGLLGIVFLLLYFFLKIQCCYFFAFAFILFYIIETHIGRMHDGVFLLILLLSPLSVYIFKVFGFPLRLELTELAAKVLTIFYEDVRAFGNLVYINNKSYSVDPACMGLKMMNTGLVIQLFFVAYFSRRHDKNIGLAVIALLMLLGSVFLVVSNFFRIILLVISDFPPESFGHEMIGILCLLVYAIIPMFF
jgi:exosortase N